MGKSDLSSKKFIFRNQISIDHQHIQIGNEDIFLRAGEFHYFRVVPAEWEDRLKKMIDLGMNAVSTYIPWNWHEITPGQYDFTTPTRNLAAFFELCKKYHLYILARPGPWISAEWQNGGIPQWLIEKHPEILAQTIEQQPTKPINSKAPAISYLHPKYLDAVKNWYEQICRQIAPYQYPGGRIILVQLDNEISYGFHYDFTSVDFNPINVAYYQQWLRAKYLIIQAVNHAYYTKYPNFDQITLPIHLLKKPQTEAGRNGLLPFLDWMEFKEWLLIRYMKRLVEFSRNNGIRVPFYLNTTTMNSPFNPLWMQFAEEEGILIGHDYYPSLLPESEKGDLELVWNIELQKTLYSHLPFASEIQTGSYSKSISRLHTNNVLRLAIGNGIKAMAMYMIVGGTNPPGMSTYSQTITSNGIDPTGQSYDYGAPIGEFGELNQRFKIIQQFNTMVQTHQSKLSQAEKVYDSLTWIHYFPYTRLKELPQREDDAKYNGTKQFGFVIDYIQLDRFYRYYFQIANQWNLQTDILELSKATSEKLQEKQTLFVSFYGWMAHADMIKLKEFIIHGGTLISMGDIPYLNEYFEEDQALIELYGAECISEDNSSVCVWMNDATTQEITNIERLYEYRIFNQNNLKVLAHDGEFQHTYAFARDIEEGRIIHTGLMLPPIPESLPHFINLLELTNFTSKFSSASKECVLIQMICPSGERFAVIGNLQAKPIEKVSFLFNHPQIEKFNPIEIENMILPAQTVMIWPLNYFISNEIQLEYATAELIQIDRVSPLEWNYFFYFPFRSNQTQHRKVKTAIIIKNSKIQMELHPPNVKYQKRNVDLGLRIIIEQTDTFKLTLLDGTKRYQFHYIPYALLE